MIVLLTVLFEHAEIDAISRRRDHARWLADLCYIDKLTCIRTAHTRRGRDLDVWTLTTITPPFFLPLLGMSHTAAEEAKITNNERYKRASSRHWPFANVRLGIPTLDAAMQAVCCATPPPSLVPDFKVSKTEHGDTAHQDTPGRHPASRQTTNGHSRSRVHHNSHKFSERQEQKQNHMLPRAGDRLS